MAYNFRALILAAGSGSRMHSTEKKQFMDLWGRPIIFYPLYTFRNLGYPITLVISKSDEKNVSEILNEYGFNDIKLVYGGNSRAESVLCGLMEVSEEYVHIHDGARPFVSPSVIDRCRDGALKYGGAIAAVPLKDTVKIIDRSDFSPDPFIRETPDRSLLYAAQTPQSFKTDLVRAAYLLAKEKNLLSKVTDDASLLEIMGEKVRLVKGDYLNLKITDPGDLLVVRDSNKMLFPHISSLRP